MKHLFGSMPEVDALIGGARRILIASDFDGTLCPIANSPAAVHLANSTLQVLAGLNDSRGSRWM
jgi:trehalose-6-phosphatase